MSVILGLIIGGIIGFGGGWYCKGKFGTKVADDIATV